MNRDMSFELDGTFMDRNAGEVVTLSRPRVTALRTPGAAIIATQAERAIPGPTDYALARPQATQAPGLSGILDTVTANYKPVIIGVALGAALMFFLRKK